MRFRAHIYDPDTKPAPDSFGTPVVKADPVCSGNCIDEVIKWAMEMLKNAGPRAYCNIYEMKEKRLESIIKKEDGKLDVVYGSLTLPEQNP